MNGRTLLGIALVAIGVLALADVMVDVAFLPEYIEAQFSSKENMKNRNRFGGLRVVKPLKDDHTYPGINLKTRLVSTWQLPFPWQEHSESCCKLIRKPASRSGPLIGRKRSSARRMNSIVRYQ